MGLWVRLKDQPDLTGETRDSSSPIEIEGQQVLYFIACNVNITLLEVNLVLFFTGNDFSFVC